MSRAATPPSAAGARARSAKFAWSVLPFTIIIRLYQVTLSPFLGGQCRYSPTCSHYGLESYREHGAWRGTWMTICRILRCHPFVKGGYDPVPPREENTEVTRWTE